jgi:hypothetical protein
MKCNGRTQPRRAMLLRILRRGLYGVLALSGLCLALSYA